VPELPDIAIYLEALERRVLGQTLDRVRVASPFLLRTAQPPVRMMEGAQPVEHGRGHQREAEDEGERGPRERREGGREDEEESRRARRAGPAVEKAAGVDRRKGEGQKTERHPQRAARGGAEKGERHGHRP